MVYLDSHVNIQYDCNLSLNCFLVELKIFLCLHHCVFNLRCWSSSGVYIYTLKGRLSAPI